MTKINILHYTVGMNKNRGGGLTKYVDDLISVQKKYNNVFVIYPGKMKVLNKEIKIKEERKQETVKFYSIINPLPLPMMFGLQSNEYLYKKSKINIWKSFLKKNEINIIHMHTLMGIYEEFIDAANELKIPILYTTHDYFGICPKQTLFYKGNICKEWNSCINCPKCNMTAIPKWKTYIIHSKVFSFIRKLTFFKILKSKEKRKIDKLVEKCTSEEFDVKYYVSLKEKMVRQFKKITYFHFNSSITDNVFHSAIPNIKGEVLNISHKDIVDNRRKKNFNSPKLRVAYLGPITSFKGFDDIIKAIDDIYLNDKNIELTIYADTELKREYLIKNKRGYSYKDLENVFDKTDILIAPSKCYETFGFTVAEALSYGTPVIVSKYIGAKDLVKNGQTGFIIDNYHIKNKLKVLMKNKQILRDMNESICKLHFKGFYEHCENINSLYKKIIEMEKEKRK